MPIPQEERNDGLVFLILAIYGYFLYDSYRGMRWAELSVRAYIMLALWAYVFLLPYRGAVGLLQPLQRLHSALDELPVGVLVGGFLLLFTICHQRIYGSSAQDLQAHATVLVPHVGQFFAKRKKGAAAADEEVTPEERRAARSSNTGEEGNGEENAEPSSAQCSSCFPNLCPVGGPPPKKIHQRFRDLEMFASPECPYNLSWEGLPLPVPEAGDFCRCFDKQEQQQQHGITPGSREQEFCTCNDWYGQQQFQKPQEREQQAGGGPSPPCNLCRESCCPMYRPLVLKAEMKSKPILCLTSPEQQDELGDNCNSDEDSGVTSCSECEREPEGGLANISSCEYCRDGAEGQWCTCPPVNV